MNSYSPNDHVRVEGYEDIAAEAGLLSGKREIPAWATSLALHLALLFGLFCITYTVDVRRDTVLTSSIEDFDPEHFKFEATVQDQVGNDSDANLLSPSQAAAMHVQSDPQEKVEQQLEQEIVDVSPPVTDSIPLPPESEFLEKFDATGATENPGGVEGAIDRLAWEIAASLREQRTLVVWVLDASPSVDMHREKIANRLENVYQQLGKLTPEAHADKALKTAVMGFGEKPQVVTPEPVDTLEDVVKAIRDVKRCQTGTENVFTALEAAFAKWSGYRTKMRRNVMMIIVTDERGDDPEKLESVVQKFNRVGIRVFCVGHAAPFGREHGYLEEYTDDDGYVWKDLPMDQGPETAVVERVDLPFWGSPSRDLRYLSSGYGPWALTRLCAETGGLYLISDESRIRFDHAVMRNYQPDFRPIRDYEADVKRNMAKYALVGAAMSTRVKSVPNIQLTFQANNDNVLRQQITEAQKPMAELDHRLNEMVTYLQQGEKDRPKLDAPRWRASFDLAMGRVLAMRARAYGYNFVLAEMKSSPRTFQTKGSNMWRLAPSSEITAGPQVRKLATTAAEYLTRVIDEHPGTPWALIAERELGQPMGWEWREGTMSIAGMGQGQGNDAKTVQLAPDEEKKREMERKKEAARPSKPPPI